MAGALTVPVIAAGGSFPLLGTVVELHTVLLWGTVATLLLTGIMYVSREVGISRMSIPFMLGTMVTRNRRKAKVLGFLVHMVNGLVFSFFYAFLFESIGRVSWWLGGLGGLIHAFVVLTVGMVLIPFFHPRMADERQGPTPTRWLQPPDVFARNYGRRTPLMAVVAHLVYGVTLGLSFQLASPATG